MEVVYILNFLTSTLLMIIGTIYTIKQRRRFIELINFQIDKKTIFAFLIMVFLGAIVMAFIFILNKKLGFIFIESSSNLTSSLKQIPKDFSSAFGEEFILRVFIFIALIFLIGNKITAITFSSLLFSFLHGPSDLISFSSYFIAGLMYGLAFLKFKTIWAPIGLHFSWNFFQGAIFGFPVSHLTSTGYFNLKITSHSIWNGGEMGPEGSLIGIVGRILIIAFLILFTRKFEMKKSTVFLNIEKLKW